jgi:hypothetical protein
MKKAVFIVLAVMLLAFGLASSAMAIDGLAQFEDIVINPGGTGDSLVYGYYNVRQSINIFTIINTSNNAGAKVRFVFRAGATSEEVLDFEVCLSEGDEWSAYLINNGGIASICSTTLLDSDTVTAPVIPATCYPFTTPSDLTNNDVLEGYFEAIGFSSLPGYDKNASSTSLPTSSSDTNPSNYIKTAQDCQNWYSSSTPSEATLTGPVGNVLFGNSAIINLSTLETFDANAIAIAFDNMDRGNGTPYTAIQDPGPSSEVGIILGDNNDCYDVETAFKKLDIISPYDLIPAIEGQTAVIVLFPTRHECHNTDVSTDTGTDNEFTCLKNQSTSSPYGSCVAYCTPIAPTIWDNAENTQASVGFSPETSECLPWELNVIELGSSDVWPNSTLATTIGVTAPMGWLDISLLVGNSSESGLPAFAWTTQTYAGGASSYMVLTGYKSFFNSLTFPFQIVP